LAGVLDRLRNKIEAEVDERIRRLEPKLDRLIALLEEMNKILKKIEENTRK